MSYNPTRFEQNKNLRPQSPPLGSGTSHSAIMKKYSGTSYVPAGEKKQTPYGYSIDLFSNDLFCTRFDVIYQKNNLGLGVNAKGDKTFLVVKGTAYVVVEVGGSKDVQGTQEILKISTGNCFHAPRNTVYSIGTSGTDGVELHVVETLDYAKTWKQLETPTVGIGEGVGFTDSISFQPQVVKRSGQDPRTVQQALEIAAQADQRRRTPKKASVQPSSANSSNVIGANPRPSGIPSEE